MSALPNPLPSQQLPKKPAGRAAKPNRLWERQRKSSDYDKGTGYAPLFHGFLADWGRISSGHIADMMFMVCNCRSLGRTVAKGKPREEWTEDITYSDVAQLCAASEEWPKMIRSIEREFARWQESGIAEVVKTAPGTVKVRLRYREWAKVKDYKSNVVEMPPAAEEPAEDEAEQREGFQKFKAVTLAPGKASKPAPINCGTKSLQYEVTGAVDIRFVTVIEGGCQKVSASVPDEWIRKLGKTKVVLPETKELDDKSRHGCRENGGNSQTVGAVHPRAEELAAIFDPLLKKSQARLLSTDESSLLTACAALGAMPRNDLISALMGGNDPRAARPICSPKHVAKIVDELRRNWEKAGGVPDVQLPKQSPLSPKGQRVAENLKRMYGK